MPIAHFSKYGALVFAACIGAFSILFSALIFYSPPWHLDVENALILPLRLFIWICTTILFVRSLAIFRQLLIGNRNAIWIDNEKLIYLDTFKGCWFVKIPLNTIESVQPGNIASWANLQAIVLVLQDGAQRTIRSWPWEEPAAVVIARLAEVIHHRDDRPY